MSDMKVDRYAAAGGVVVHNGKVLVLHRPARGEMRLPKGHVELGETVQKTALRETSEESGYTGLVVMADLGTQEVTFQYGGRRILRTEHYFLMKFEDPEPCRGKGESQFQPVWLNWPKALAALTFEAEREWVRRARAALPGAPELTRGK